MQNVVLPPSGLTTRSYTESCPSAEAEPEPLPRRWVSEATGPVLRSSAMARPPCLRARLLLHLRMGWFGSSSVSQSSLSDPGKGSRNSHLPPRVFSGLASWRWVSSVLPWSRWPHQRSQILGLWAPCLNHRLVGHWPLLAEDLGTRPLQGSEGGQGLCSQDRKWPGASQARLCGDLLHQAHFDQKAGNSFFF